MVSTPSRGPSPVAITAVGIFLVFGACMAGLAGSTLIWQGTALDRLWSLNKPAHQLLAPFGAPIGVLFLLLSASLAVAAGGWFKRRRWGWRLAVGIIAMQVAGDFVNMLRGDFLRGITGFVIAGALLFYLLRPTVRSTFLDN